MFSYYFTYRRPNYVSRKTVLIHADCLTEAWKGFNRCHNIGFFGKFIEDIRCEEIARDGRWHLL